MRDRKKVITYGLRYADYARQRYLFALRNNGDIEITAEIGYAPQDEEIFYKRMSLREALALEHDAIIVCGGDEEQARGALRDAGIALEREHFSDIHTMLAPHLEEVKKTQLGILSELVHASDAEIRDREWLGERIRDYGIYPFFKLAKEPEPDITWSTMGILQVPEEFTELCLALADFECKEAVEIGVARGGSSYILAAIMYRNAPDMKYHMVDIHDALTGYEEVKKIIPSLVKEIPATSEDFKEKAFDFCFIDADHSYEGMMSDWNNAGRHAKKLTVFHDIYAHEYDGLNGGTVRGWSEIKQIVPKERIREISVYPERWMGIGMVYSPGQPAERT